MFSRYWATRINKNPYPFKIYSKSFGQIYFIIAVFSRRILYYRRDWCPHFKKNSSNSESLTMTTMSNVEGNYFTPSQRLIKLTFLLDFPIIWSWYKKRISVKYNTSINIRIYIQSIMIVAIEIQWGSILCEFEIMRYKRK